MAEEPKPKAKTNQKCLAEMSRRDERYKIFCKCQQELSDEVKQLTADMENLGQKLLASKEEAKLQSALLDQAIIEAAETNKALLEHECVARMLAESADCEINIEDLDIEKILKEIEEKYGAVEDVK